MGHTPLLKVLTVLLAVLACASPQAHAWVTRAGVEINGDPAGFDHQRKIVAFVDPITHDETSVAAEALSLRSRQRLLLSRHFHQSYPEAQAWPSEKRHFLALAVFTPAIFLLMGFWISGWLVTGQLNPLRALYGFAGSWIVGAILLACYLRLAESLDSPLVAIGIGCLIATAAISLFISVVYNTQFLHGLFLFLLQMIVALALLAATFAAGEIALPLSLRERLWTDHVFAPVGLVSASEKSAVNPAR